MTLQIFCDAEYWISHLRKMNSCKREIYWTLKRLKPAAQVLWSHYQFSGANTSYILAHEQTFNTKQC